MMSLHAFYRPIDIVFRKTNKNVWNDEYQFLRGKMCYSEES